ncbi:DNA polymerase I [Candidatus Margulisiibacteriota bacterium]
MNKKLLIIDSHNIIFRSYFAIPPMSNKKGEPTQAILGFLNTLFKVIEKLQPDEIVTTFDVAKSFRRDIYEEYKAHRPPAPDDLKQQVKRIKEIIKTINMPTYEKEGYEADDIIGTIVEKTKNKNVDCYVLSGDKDLFQLVDDHCKIIMPQARSSEDVLYDAKKVKEKIGVKPDQVVDLKALMGDSSDNIPGVHGVGGKTAAQLLEEFKTIDNLIKNTDKIKKDKLRRDIEKEMDNIKLSKKLAEIVTNVPIDFKVEKTDIEWEKAVPIFEELEMKSIINRIVETKHVKSDEALKERSRTSSHKKEQPPKKPSPITQQLINTWIAQNCISEKYTAIEECNEKDWKKCEKEIKEKNLEKVVYDIEIPLYPIIRKMEKVGITIDTNYLKELEKEFNQEIKKHEQKIYKIAGTEFNINSSKQLGEILFTKLKIPPVKKIKTGFSTDASVLEKLASDNVEIAQHIIDYRTLAKLLTTYVTPLPKVADENNRIHSTFNQLGTTTGRLSSNNPNLQNIPVRTKEGMKIRKAFIPGKPYNRIISADYSQIELRLFAHMADETSLIEAFKKDRDIHTQTASEIFNVAYEKVSKEVRHRAKAINFGILYGMGASGLAKTTGITTKEAKEFIEKYFNRYPKLKGLLESTKKSAHKNGYVTTMFGRRRYFPDIKSSNAFQRSFAERAAINAPMQGTAADIIKLAMIEIDKKINEEHARMIVQIHDELLFEAKNEHIEKTKKEIKSIMENVVSLKVPIKVEVTVGTNWLACK